MKCALHYVLSLFIIAIAVFAGLPHSTAVAQTARQLPAEIRADQTPPDITITGGFVQGAGIGDFNGDGVTDFLVRYAHFVGQEAQTFVFFKFGIIFGHRNQAQLRSINLLTDEPDLALTTSVRAGVGDSYIATFGDLNGDGIDDIVVTHLFNQPVGQPRPTVFKIFFGSPRLQPGVIDIDALPPDLTILTGTFNPSSLNVVGAADVNGDGAKDLLLAVNTNYINAAAAILLGPFAPGATIDLTSQPPDVLIQENNRSENVNAMFVADVNGDRISDVLIRRSHFDSETGLNFTALDVIFGAANWKPGTTISLTERPADATIIAGFNYTVIQVADVNGDGINDVLVGRPTHYGAAPPTWFAGDVSIFFGAPALGGVISQPGAVITGLPIPEPFHPAFQTVLGDNLGQSLAVGDVNGDGVPDLLVGAPGATTNDNGKVLYMNRAHVIIGSPEMKPGARIATARAEQDVTISFDTKTSGFGRRVATGDFNGDGVQDILVSNDGVAYVYFSGPLRAPQLTSAKYRAAAGELTIFGKDFTGSARVEINGVVIDRPVSFDAEQGRLTVQGGAAELNLHGGKNQIVVLRKGARSNAVAVKIK